MSELYEWAQHYKLKNRYQQIAQERAERRQNRRRPRKGGRRR